MAITLQINASSALKGKTLKSADNWTFNLTTSTSVITNGVPSQRVDRDALVTDNQGATYSSSIRINLLGYVADPQFSSLTPGVASVNSSGVTTAIANDLAKIKITNAGQMRVANILANISTNSTLVTLNSWLEGTLARHCSDAVDNRLAGKSASASRAIYSTQNHNSANYVRNPNFWAHDIVQKLTCISPWNSQDANGAAGTLISPRHLLFAGHYMPSDGVIIRFVDANGTVYNRTVVKILRHPSYSVAFADIAVGVLDSDLPSSITPCLMSPANLIDNFANLNFGVPALCLDQEEKGLVTDLISLSPWASFGIPTNAKRLEFYEDKITGDSGNPAFLIVNDELTLLTVWTSGGAGSGTFVGGQLPAINQLIVDVDTLAGYSTVANPTWPNSSGHYQVKTVNISAFPTYS